MTDTETTTVETKSTFWQQFDNFMAIEAEKSPYRDLFALPIEERRQAKRERRRLLCGHRLVFHIDPHNGSMRKASVQCGLWRDSFCERCMDYRKNKFRGQLMNVGRDATPDGSDFDFVHMSTITRDEFKRRFRKVPKADYKAFPQADDIYVVFTRESDDPDFGQRLYEFDLLHMDFDFVNTPEGKRVSGSLGSRSDSTGMVQVPWIVLDPNDDKEKQAVIEKEAFAHALEETAGLNPTNLPDINKAVRARTDSFLSKYFELGGKILLEERTRYLKVHLTRISWNCTYALNDIERMVDDPEEWDKECAYLPQDRH